MEKWSFPGHTLLLNFELWFSSHTWECVNYSNNSHWDSEFLYLECCSAVNIRASTKKKFSSCLLAVMDQNINNEIYLIKPISVTAELIRSLLHQTKALLSQHFFSWQHLNRCVKWAADYLPVHNVQRCLPL